MGKKPEPSVKPPLAVELRLIMRQHRFFSIAVGCPLNLSIIDQSSRAFQRGVSPAGRDDLSVLII